MKKGPNLMIFKESIKPIKYARPPKVRETVLTGMYCLAGYLGAAIGGFPGSIICMGILTGWYLWE